MAFEHPRVRRLWDADTLGASSPLLSLTSSAHALATPQPPPTAPYVPRTSAILHAAVDSESSVVSVWMPDKCSGRQLVRVSSGVAGAAPSVTSSTSAIPSSRRIHSVAMSTSGVALVSDDIGNVFQLDASNESAAKRHRTEGSTPSPHALQWNVALRASAHAPQRGCLPAYGTGGGWVGLISLTPSLAVCSREHFLDSRIFDSETSAIVKSIQHMHGPTALTTVPALGVNTVVFAEGPLLASYDVRLPSAKSATNRSSLPVSAAFSHVVDLGPQRPHEIATCSSDRSVIIWDVRNWTRVTTLSAVLKYSTMSAAPIAGGAFLVCSGVDSEVRVCSTAPISGKSHQQPVDPESAPVVSSFRNRVNETEHCESTWHGAWTSDVTGSVAVGMAITGEVYVARSEPAPSAISEL
jgi:WD40 repeat protein